MVNCLHRPRLAIVALLLMQGLSASVWATTFDVAPPPLSATVKPGEFSSCNVRQENQLAQLLLDAQLRLTTLSAELDDAFADAASNGAPRFERWFGYFDSERFARVRTIYRNILKATETQTIKFDCRCSAYPGASSVSAYVYSSNHYNINLCPRYWPLSSAWQRAILVHELSHFAVLGNARDFSYGHFATAQLAIDSPEEAIRNAESYTLFFLNSPPIPLASTTDAPETPLALQLASGASHDGMIGKRQTALYGIQGANRVVLQPNNGADVDLHIYLGRERVCVSNRAGDTAEQCELDPTLAYSAEVIPFTNDLAEAYLYTILTSQDQLPAELTLDKQQSVEGGSGGGAVQSLSTLALTLWLVPSMRRRRDRLKARNKSR